MGIETAGLIIAGIAAGASAYNTYETNKQAEAATVQAIESQRKREGETANQIGQTVAGLRASSPEAEKQANIGQYLTTVREGQAGAEQGLQAAGAVSDRFTTGAAGAASDIASTAATRAGQLGAIDAATQQRQREGIDFGNLGLALSGAGRRAGSDAFLSDLKIKKASQRDPWIDALASAGKGYAASGGGMEFGWGGV
jgi:hypothetical protein